MPYCWVGRVQLVMELCVVDGYLVGINSNNWAVLGVQLANLGRILGASFVNELVISLVPLRCCCKARPRKSGKGVEKESINCQSNEYNAAADSCKDAEERQAGAAKDGRYCHHVVQSFVWFSSATSA